MSAERAPPISFAPKGPAVRGRARVMRVAHGDYFLSYAQDTVDYVYVLCHSVTRFHDGAASAERDRNNDH